MKFKSSTLIAVILVVALLGVGYVATRPATPTGAAVTPTDNQPADNQPVAFQTFETKAGATVCTEDGKPVIRLFSTTWCPHCQWIKATFDSIAKEYVAAGKIVAYHWELDSYDDTLTDAVETAVPDSEMQIFSEFSDGSIPTFVFGCKYFRIGNGYEQNQDLNAEELEIRAVIEQLISEAK